MDPQGHTGSHRLNFHQARGLVEWGDPNFCSKNLKGHGTCSWTEKDCHINPWIPYMSSMARPAPMQLRLWQQNINKSNIVQEDLINSDIHKNYDMVLLQEPYLDRYGNMRATRYWQVVYPLLRLTCSDTPWSIMLVNAALDPDQWVQLTIKDTGDLMAMQL